MKTIAITGGKGGTGKSTVATALAYELSKKSKVLLVDADVDCPNDHLILGIQLKKINSVMQRIPNFNKEKCAKCGRCGEVCKPNAIVSIKDKFPIFIPTQCNGCGSCKIACPNNAISWDEKEIGEIFFGTKENLSLLSGSLKVSEPVSEFIVNQLNKKIEKSVGYDYVIIDTAAGTHCPVIAALENAEKIIAVTEPTPLGVHDLEQILKLLSIMKKKSKIIINRSDLGDSNKVKELSKRYNSKVLLEIKFSKEIVDAYSNNKPIIIKGLLEVIK